ncbi:hypothetical protein LTR08_000932 [Meristemomyces frigidus]|nr:hypothetical protein LTR08_000932 [Meristemomyces frigidus]
MANAHLSSTPMDPYEWRESVLSTRSLSHISIADLHGSHSRNASLNRFRPQPVTATDDSDYDLEMSGTNDGERGLNDIPELPESVVDSALFTLPREIRDRIYSYCLTAQLGLPVEWPSLPGAKAAYDLQPQLLRTCSIIHDEAAPLLYSLNIMTFHHPSDANMFVRAIASPALARKFVTHVSMHVKAMDTRLWMPYLSSTDEHRSLKADFPWAREVGVRFRSNKWNHSVPPEVNLKAWAEDSRLDEIIDGLRHVFRAPPPPPPPPKGHPPDHDDVKPINEMNAREFARFVDGKRPGEDMAFKQHLLELHKAHVPLAVLHPRDPPAIKVICACRVHSAHFNTLTSPASASASASGPLNPHRAVAAAILAAHAIGGDPQPEVAMPVREGEPFRGFTAVDFLKGGVKKLHDPDLGSARVARTSFAMKDGVGVALEIHCLESVKHARVRGE